MMSAVTSNPAIARVLVVDDDHDLVLATRRLLEDAGYHAETAETIKEANSILSGFRPDLVLLDRILPDGDGIDLCRKIKNSPVLGSPLVILLSGLRTAGDDQADGLYAGADGYVVRPVGNRELVARVESILRLSRRNRSLRTRAEKEALRRKPLDPPATMEEAQVLIHELQVHQAEIDIQNEEMRHSQAQLEASRNQYATLFETAPMGYALLDKNGIIQQANTTLSRMVGISAGRIQDEPFTRWIDNSDRSLFLSRFRAFWQQPVDKVMEISLLRQDGATIRVELRGSIIPAGPGHLKPSLLVSVSDISQRIEFEKKILRLSEILRSLRDINKLASRVKDSSELISKVIELLVKDRGFSHASIALVDEQGKITECSHSISCDELKDFSQKFPVGQEAPCYSTLVEQREVLVCQPEDCNPPIGVFWDAGKANLQLSYLLELKGKVFGVLYAATNGDFGEMENEKALFREVCDDIAYILHGLSLEIQKQEAYESMHRAKEEAVSANRAKDDFLAVMSHELRTPLNPIIGFSSLMLADADEHQSEMLKSMQDSGERMLAMVERILDFTRLDKAEVRVKATAFSPLECCKVAFEGIRLQKDSLDHEFINGTGDLKPLGKTLMVRSDRDMLMRILENLLSNASKYTIKGGIKLTVGMREGWGGLAHFEFIVEDTGIGMNPLEQEKIFDAFTQADSSFTRSYEGVGLGLAITQKLVDLLDGEINFESEKQKGSRFSVTLPLEIVDTMNVDTDTPSPKPVIEHKLSAELDVLVVDDEDDNNVLSRILLKKIGARPTIATSGNEAIDKAGSQKFDIILMDVRMPGMNGFDTTAAIRNSSSCNADTPILALSANVVHDIKEDAAKAGMSGFITKPIRLDTLFAELEKVAQNKLQS